MASAGQLVSAGGGGNESARCARAIRPALTTPKTPVVTKNCAQWRLKTAAPQRPHEKEPTVHQRQDRSDRKPLVRDSHLVPAPAGIPSCEFPPTFLHDFRETGEGRVVVEMNAGNTGSGIAD